jgi:hypothetical protein
MRTTHYVIGTLMLLFMSCKDMGDTPTKPPLAASSLAVTLIPGGQIALVINGGTPPYTISQRPDTLLASALLTNNTNGSGSLLLRATSENRLGTTIVKIRDSDSHESSSDGPLHEENEIEISIRISGTTVSFGADVQPLFNNSCVGCHGGSGGLSLASGQSYTNLVNAQAQAGCTTQKRVQPGDATVSVLYKRISGSDCGSRMPKNLAPLASSDIAKIRDWINQGALNN